MIKQTYKPQQIAELLQVDVDTVRAWINAGELDGSNVSRPGSRKARWLVKEDDLEAFLEKRRPSVSANTTRRKKKKPTDVIKFF